MQALQLAVNLSGWRSFIRRREDKAFLPVAKRIWERDDYLCQYCGFQAKEYQEVVNLDGNYQHNKIGNLITACCFCSQCLFIQSVGIDQVSGGQLVYLPEITQMDLNSFCHVLFCAMRDGTGYQETAQNVYRGFKFRSQLIENKFGSGTSNPAVFGQLLLEYQENNQTEVKQDIFHAIRLLPSYTGFKMQLDGWAKSALEELAMEAGQSA